MLRLAATPRWLGFLAIAVVFAILCTLFGVWQWNRREEALAAIARLEANWSATPVPLAEALPHTDDYTIAQQWLPVVVEGEYLADEQLLLRARVRDGEVGFNVITPFLTTDGTVFIVDRGWLPAGDSIEAPDLVPPAPEGTITIVARLRANEGQIIGRSAPEGQLSSVDLDVLATQFDVPVYTGAYGLIATEDGVIPRDIAPHIRPELDEGPHLSYTLQWFVFAAMGLFAYGWALRREAHAGDEDGDDHRPRPPRRRSDADEEDAILDAME